MATTNKKKAASTDVRKVRQQRSFSQEFKQEAVQMLLDGHSAVSVAERLGLPGANLLYRWAGGSHPRGPRQPARRGAAARRTRTRHLKKSVGYLKPANVADMYALIEQLTLLGPFPLMVLCDTLEVSRAGYYAWLADSVTAHQERDRELMPLVCDIFWQHKRRYGARRIAVELAARGKPCGVDRVAKLLKMQGLRAIQPQGYKPRTTNSQHTLGYNPNLLLRSSPPAQLNRVWVADITYLPLKIGGFAYLASLLDLCSRRVVGWSLDMQMTDSLVIDALQKAIALRQPPPGLVHHSDRGGQYVSVGRQNQPVIGR